MCRHGGWQAGSGPARASGSWSSCCFDWIAAGAGRLFFLAIVAVERRSAPAECRRRGASALRCSSPWFCPCRACRRRTFATARRFLDSTGGRRHRLRFGVCSRHHAFARVRRIGAERPPRRTLQPQLCAGRTDAGCTVAAGHLHVLATAGSCPATLERCLDSAASCRHWLLFGGGGHHHASACGRRIGPERLSG